MLAVTIMLRTTDFAAKAHGTQTRKNKFKLPYITHPISVARILAEEGAVSELKILQAALLHDVAEDTKTTLKEIASKFGDEVANIVAEVTDDKSLPKAERKRLQVAKAATKSREAKLVKLADKLDNLRDLQRCPPESWSQEVVQGYFLWAKAVVQGLRGTNYALECKLDEVFAGSLEFHGATIPCVPVGDEAALLEQYYALMTAAD